MTRHQRIRIGMAALCLTFGMLWVGCDHVSDDATGADTGDGEDTGGGSTDGNGDSDGNGNDGGDGLSGREFQSIDITEDGEPMDLVDGTTLVIAFGTDGTLSVRAGCNLMAGSYEMEDGALKTGALSMTMMGCDEALHDQDNWVLAVLGAAPVITQDGDTITLTAILDDDTTVVIVLTDADVLNPPLPLAGTVWTVTTVIDGDVASSADWLDPATLVFGEDGVLALYTGCNSGAGEYTVTGDTITIGALAVSDRGCMDPDISQLENDVMAVVSGGSLTFAIRKNSLTLSSGDRALGLQGEQ